MIPQVMELAVAAGWIDRAAGMERTVLLSQGASLSMILSRCGVPEVFVKFSNLVTLQQEADRNAQACMAYARHAPAFLGHRSHGTLEAMASRAVQTRAVTVAMARSSRDSQQVQDGLDRFFSQTRALAEQAATHAWISAMQRYFGQLALSHVALRTLGDLQARLADLPPMRQHGDFVMNNLALNDRTGLVVFDWEDFGEIALPGLDLFTLEISLSQEAEWARNSGHQVILSRLLDVDQLCACIGLSRRSYSALRLVHALAFRYLKRNYGPEIQARLDTLIRSAVD